MMQLIPSLLAYDPDPGGSLEPSEGKLVLIVGVAIFGGIGALLWLRHKLNEGRPLGSLEALKLLPPVPGKFQVFGVDRATAMDTNCFIDAQSPENAKAKAELQGIVVTRVVRA
jgi:hypothetical protein